MDDKALRYLLSDGDRRSIGKVDEAVAGISGSPSGIAAAVRLMRDADPVVTMRASGALEKATRGDPGLLTPHKRELLGDIAAHPQQEVRWHVLQMLPRLPLTASEHAKALRSPWIALTITAASSWPTRCRPCSLSPSTMAFSGSAPCITPTAFCPRDPRLYAAGRDGSCPEDSRAFRARRLPGRGRHLRTQPRVQPFAVRTDAC